jgi:heat shock protein HtpX
MLVLVGIIVIAVGAVPVGGAVAAIGVLVLVGNEIVGRPAAVISRIGGRILSPGEQPGLRNIVEGLCVASGQSVPELRLLDEGAPNAIALYRRRGEAVLFCTAGLLVDLDRIELEGVIAHELAHIKNGDARRAANAMAACGTLALISRQTPIAVLVLGDPRREVLADLGASAITRYPRGLLSALSKIGSDPRATISSLGTTAYRLTAALWCAPLNSDQRQRVREGVFDLTLRVETLAEL